MIGRSDDQKMECAGLARICKGACACELIWAEAYDLIITFSDLL